MVLMSRNGNVGEAMPQTVPSAGFTPSCDYSNFADTFDLSLLSGDETLPVSPSTTLYSPPPMSAGDKPKIYATFYPNSPSDIDNDIDFGPDFQKLLGPETLDKNHKNLTVPTTYLDVPQNHPNSPNNSLSPYSPNTFSSPSEHQSFYPSSPEGSFYPHSPNSHYSHSPSDFHGLIKSENYYATSPLPAYVKEESYRSPCSSILSPNSPATSQSSVPSPPQYNHHDVIDLFGNAIIKQETTVDFGSILQSFPTLLDCYKEAEVVDKPKADHQLLRKVLRDTSFQKKHNIRLFDFDFGSDIKMEEPEESDMINTSEEHFPRHKIEPVLNMAIEQLRKDVNTTCAALKISPDASQWTSANVLSWLQCTANQFSLPPPVPEQWDIAGSSLISFTEDEFARRAPQSGSMLHAQLVIWKEAFSGKDRGSQWMPETASSNASSGDISDDEEEESPEIDSNKPSTSRAATTTGSSHIHLWQFLKELLSSPQTHGSCIRWIDRTKGIFKIEDSVRVARLWGKRKNRPAMNYDKLSRSIRQYYKKGIMKKTERSQRLVYQFCHPYNL